MFNKTTTESNINTPIITIIMIIVIIINDINEL